MTTHPELGSNRTGIATARELTEDMIAGTVEFLPDTQGDEREISHVREDYAREAEPLGTIPPPRSLKGVVKTAAEAIKGASPSELIDKLGERLAFERSGVRIYEALISKLDVFGSFEGGPERADLELILREEFEHFRMLEEAVTGLGGDATVVTPSADLQATLSRGIIEVTVDPRTNFRQCLEAALLAELADNDSWDALLQLAEKAGEEEIAERCERAVSEEREHLLNVRVWLAAAQGRLG